MSKINWEPKINHNIYTFCPNWSELAQRHLKTARHHKYIYEQHGDTPKGREAVSEAERNLRMAQFCIDQNNEARTLRDYGRTN